MSNTNPFGALLEGFAGGAKTASDAKARDKLIELETERQRVQQQRDLSAVMDQSSQTAAGSSVSAAPTAGGARPPAAAASGGAVTPGKPFKTTDPVATDLAPHQRAFLNAIAGGESGGRYDIRYDGGAGSTIGDLSRHPGIFVPTADGQKSSAAGRYQFTKSTWDAMGGGDFSPANQDRRAWALAQQRYKAVAGRDLDADLRGGGLTPQIMASLTPTWQAFGANRGRHIATYNDSLSRYGSGGAAPAVTAPTARSIAPSPPSAPRQSGALGVMADLYPTPRTVMPAAVPTI